MQSLNLPKHKIKDFEDFKTYILHNINATIEDKRFSNISALKKAIDIFEFSNDFIFYTETLPGIIELASNLEILNIQHSIDKDFIELTRFDIGTILAHNFLCNGKVLWKNSSGSARSMYGNIFKRSLRFDKWYDADCDEVVQMILCVLNYFHAIISPFTVTSEKVTFKRCKGKENPMDVDDSMTMGMFAVDSSREEYTQLDNSTAKVVFVENKSVGMELVSKNCFQEEIMLVTHPELMIAALFNKLAPTDAVVVTGAKRYSLHQGFGITFKFIGPSEIEEMNPIVMVKTTILNQYNEDAIRNDLISAIAGFSELKNVDFVNFEFWAWSDHKVPQDYVVKNAVIANPAVKILTLWLAASITYKMSVFRQYINYQLGVMVYDLTENFQYNTTVAVYQNLLDYCKLMLEDPKMDSLQNDDIFNIIKLKPGYHKIIIDDKNVTWNWLLKKMEQSKKSHLQLQDIKCYDIIKVYQIFNYRLWERFLERKWEIERDMSKILSDGDFVHLFHGSKLAEEISKTGFDISKGLLNGMLGQGAYFTDLSSKGNQYTLGKFRAACEEHKNVECTLCTRTMLVCKVMMGKVYVTKGPLNGKTSAPEDCHSVEANAQKGYQSPPPYLPLAYPEYVVYNNFQAYPSFMLEYKIIT